MASNSATPKSSISPRSPILPGPAIISPRYDHDHDVCDEFDLDNAQSFDLILSNIGFENLVQISETLQGSIWRGTHQSTSADPVSSCAIKVTNKYLHQSGRGVLDGIQYSVHENIITEQAILKYITQHKDCPESIVKYRAFHESKQNYYFVMEDGGSSLFSFISKVHRLIAQHKIEIRHWKEVVKIILKQMIECIEFIHSKNVVHFDISLENFLINDVQIDVHQDASDNTKAENITFVLEGIQVKLCDFGLARLCATKQCQSTRFCGKSGYKSPEILERKCFNAKKNDIWGLGVCLFMMSLGCNPWQKAKKSDPLFAFAMEHSIAEILNEWNDLHYVDDGVLYLLDGIFQYETDRISLHHIQQFVNRYM